MRSGSRYSAMLLVQVLAVVQGHSLATESLLCEAELLYNSTGVSCNATRDTIGTCWPHSPAGMMVLLPCPESFNGLRYDSSKSVFRECLASGMWAQRSNYSFCLPIIESKKNSYYYNVAQIINYVGHCISLIALVMAFVIFWCLRSIRCLRNTIHWNFVTTFILRNTMYFLLPLIDVNTQLANEIWCRIVITVFNYFQVTNFFWMFVEGCYLHTVIVMTYSTDKLRKWLFLCLGWGIPVFIITIWALMKQHYENKECWFGENTGTYKYIDYIYQGPIILVLLVNFVFLFNIVRILMTKLRASKTSETIQYRKAVKATLVLLPLLGITYILYFVNFGRDEASNIIFVYVNSFLMSFQGFFISVFYCFLNGEVRMAIRKRWNHWMDNQSIRTRVSRAMSIPTSPTRMSIHSLKRNTSV